MGLGTAQAKLRHPTFAGRHDFDMSFAPGAEACNYAVVRQTDKTAVAMSVFSLAKCIYGFMPGINMTGLYHYSISTKETLIE